LADGASASHAVGYLSNEAHYTEEKFGGAHPPFVEGIVRALYGLNFEYHRHKPVSQTTARLTTSAIEGYERHTYRRRYSVFLTTLEVAGQETAETLIKSLG